MPHNMTRDSLEQTLTALCGTYTLDVGQSVRTIGTSLPGKAVCAILPSLGDGITRIVYDLDKPYALAHARAMLHERFAAEGQSAHQPDEPVPLVLAV